MQLNKVYWMRIRKSTGFIPYVWYTTRQQARDAIANLVDRHDYRIIKIKWIETTKRVCVKYYSLDHVSWVLANNQSFDSYQWFNTRAAGRRALKKREGYMAYLFSKVIKVRQVVIA